MEAEHSYMQAGIEEKILSELKGQSGESVSIDQGWQKRGAAMNSINGHSSMIGELSKKVISYDVRIKGGSRTCLYSYKNKTNAKRSRLQNEPRRIFQINGEYIRRVNPEKSN